MKLHPIAVFDAADEARAGVMSAALDGSLRVVRSGRIAAVVSERGGASVGRGVGSGLGAGVGSEAGGLDPVAVSRWIGELHRFIDIVPMQFGDEVEGEAELLSVLERREVQLARMLDGVRGMTEYGLRLHMTRADEGRARAEGAEMGGQGAAGRAVQRAAGSGDRGGGGAYLRSRAKYYAATDGIPEGLAGRVAGWIAGLGMGRVRARLEGGSALIAEPALHFLVPRDCAEEFVRCVEARRAELRVPATLSGPWAPFHFVRGVDASA